MKEYKREGMKESSQAACEGRNEELIRMKERGNEGGDGLLASISATNEGVAEDHDPSFPSLPSPSFPFLSFPSLPSPPLLPLLSFPSFPSPPSPPSA